MTTCVNCGRELPDGAKYCTACGTRVAADEMSSAPIPRGHRAIPWWLGVAVGVFVLSVIGALIWGGGQTPGTSVIGPPDTHAPTEPGSGPPIVPSGIETLEELSIGGVGSPGILPTSPFYCIKGITRDLEYAFTFSSDDRARLKLRYANQDALAIRQLCFDGQYVEAAQQCQIYQDDFFDSLVHTVTMAKHGGDVQSLMTNLIVAHQGHSLVLADALTVGDAFLREAVIGAVAYTSAPLEQVIQWTSGDEAAAAFHAKLRNDFSVVGAHQWEDIEDQLGLSAEEAATLATAMGETANIGNAPIVTSLKADAYQVGPGASCLMTCDARDLEGDVLRYEWLATAGRLVGDGQTATWTAPTEPGLYTVSVVVSDDSGSQTLKSINLRVEAASPPSPGYLADELFAAVQAGDGQQVKRLLHQGADVNARGIIDQTPLHNAASVGRTEVVRILLDHGADVGAVEQHGMTPLHVAAESGNSDVVVILLERGADVNVQDNAGFQPLHMAAAHGCVEAAEVLLDRGAELNARISAQDGQTALHAAAFMGHADVARLLLDRGAYVDERDWLNNTPLHLSALEGTTEIGRLLLDRGADVNARSNLVPDGTPLHFAASTCQTEVAALLLEYGADTNALAGGDVTPLLMATAAACPDMVALLEKHAGGA